MANLRASGEKLRAFRRQGVRREERHISEAAQTPVQRAGWGLTITADPVRQVDLGVHEGTCLKGRRSVRLTRSPGGRMLNAMEGEIGVLRRD